MMNITNNPNQGEDGMAIKTFETEDEAIQYCKANQISNYGITHEDGRWELQRIDWGKGVWYAMTTIKTWRRMGRIFSESI